MLSNQNLGAFESSLEGAGLVKSESMEITNDPRFFLDNVINYRLAAFAGLSVVSGLMVQNAMDNIFDMKKRMDITKFELKPWEMSVEDQDKLLQLIAFLLLGLVLFFNMVSTYVGVAQPYHTIRLMTGGPTGFEAAALYYLNKNMTAWRHFAVTGALVSLPLYVLSCSFRMVVKFDWENEKDPDLKTVPPVEDRIIGWIMFCYFLLMAATVYYIHRKHDKVFVERHQKCADALAQHNAALDVMSSRMTPRY